MGQCTIDEFVQLASSSAEPDWWEAVELGIETPDLDSDLIRLLEQSTNSKLREAAAAVFAERSVPAAFDVLIANLRLARRDLKWSIIGALGRIGDHRAVDKLLPLVGHHLYFEEAADALGAIGAPEAVPRLAKRALSESTPGHEMDNVPAVRALGRIGGDEAVGVLVRCLEDPGDAIRAEAARCLGVLKAQAAMQPLLDLFSYLPSWSQARYRVVEALGEIGDRAAVAFLEQLLADAAQADVHDAAQASLALINAEPKR